jgi:hypothetical protein
VSAKPHYITLHDHHDMKSVSLLATFTSCSFF